MKNLFLLFNILISLASFGQDINNGLIAYYPFNGNANDESGHNSHGMVNGATLTKDRNNIENSAYYFNGRDNYITASFQNINNIAVSFWFKASSQSNDYPVFLDFNKTKLYIQLLGPTYKQFNKYGKLFFRANSKDIYSNSSLDNNIWHFVYIDYSNNYGKQKLYIDGVFVNSNNISSEINLNKVNIGRQEDYLSSTFYNGYIDDVRIYNRTLSETEIAELYNDGGTTSSTNISQTSNPNSVNIYEILKKYDCYTSVTPEIYNLKTQELFLLKLSDNTLSLVSSNDWTEKKKIKNEEDEKMKLSSSYIEGNDLYIALYNQKKNEIPYYLKLNLSTLETEKIKCSKTERGCIISSASSDYIKPERNKPYKLNENVIFFRNDGTQYYYEVSKIVEEKEDYSKALNGNYKDKVNFLKKYQNSTYSKEVEKKLFDNLKSIKEVATFSKENSDYNEKSVNRAYEIAKSTKSKTELNDFINNFGSSKFASEIKAKLNTIENEEEQQRIANENARIQREKEEQNRLIAEQKAREQKIADDKKREAEYQKYLADKEKNRISKIKSATEGDKICYVQNRVSVYDDRDYFFGFQIGGSRQEVNYSMKVICFVEKNLGEKIQVRVGTVSSSNKKEYAQVVIDGVEYSKGDLLWIKPLKDSNWFIED